MGKIIVSEFVSLDSVMEAPETWHFPYISDDMAAHIEAQVNATDVMLYGRVTYTIFAGFWPTDAAKGESLADKINRTPKYVVSTTLASADWQNSTLIKTNVIDAIARLKRETPGTIGITGSATLIRALTQAGLIDEFQFLVHPIVLGQGLRLFDGLTAAVPLKLVETKTFTSGVVLLTYQPASPA
ncbi:MAG: dihydrofolate reductase family protein [Anaerolineae bacterium]|nr:dihydrofolate reductase family protein [Anaerolineae bacterium]